MKIQRLDLPAARAGHKVPSVSDLAFAIRADLERVGHAHWAGQQLLDALGPDFDIQAVAEAARAAPLDPEDADGHRYRLFGGIHFFPWIDDAGPIVVPPFTDAQSGRQFTRYSQPLTINPEAGGLERRFSPIDQKLWLVMWPLVRLLFDATPHELISRNDPVAAHVHLVSMRPSGNWAAYSVPNTIHQDLDPVTYVVLIERSPNAGGGRSIVARSRTARQNANWQDVADVELLKSFVLTEPGSGVAIWDSRVSHAVTPVYGIDGEPASRAALLIDFSNFSI